MLSNPKAAIVVDGAPDHPVTDIVQELAKANGFYFSREDSRRAASQVLHKSPKLGSQTVFLLLCTEGLTESSIADAVANLKDQRPDAARIVVYAQDGEWSGSLALDCIEAGACDFLVRTSYDRPQLMDRFSRALLGLPAYPRFRNVASLTRGSSVFIVTPFAPDARQDCNSGISIALKRLGIDPFLADYELRPSFLQGSICEQIKERKLVIANISQYGGAANANVYFEIGYTRGQEIPVLLVRHRSQEKVPSDLQGVEYLEYDTCADLALRLYFGLRESVT